MRIVSGSLGGRRFHPPARIPARPTTELAKEGLFNILTNMVDFEGIRTLDLFGGTGSITYELASRGAGELWLVERDAITLGFIERTLKEFEMSDRVRIVRGDVFKFIKTCTDSYDFIFAGPPYALQNIDDLPILIFERQMLAPGGLFVLEHTPRNDYQQHQKFMKMKNYGTTVFTFFKQPTE